MGETTCKVVFDARMYKHSGIGTYIRNLLRQYSRNELAKKMVLLAGEIIPGIDLETIICRSGIYGLSEQILLPYKIRDCGLLHSPHYNAPIICPGKLVVTIHDLNHLTFYHQLPSLFHKMYAKTMMSLVVKRADAIMTDSDWTRNDLLKRWPYADSKVKTVYCGVAEPKKHDNPQNVLDRFGIDRPYILYLGLLKKHKNLPRLIKAFCLAQRTLQEKYLLLIAGDPKSDDNNLSGLIADSPANNLIRLLGYIPEADLPALQSQAFLFAFPSIAEGFGLPPLEAMSYKVPVISSNASCLPEILKDAPLYFNPYDLNEMASCIETAMSDNDWRRCASLKGEMVAAKYKWHLTAGQCLEIYYNLIGKQ